MDWSFDLLDPIEWSEHYHRSSVFGSGVSVSFAGPRRYTPPAMSIDKLPPIDYAVISHNHYDHLDLDSVTAIGNQCLWLLPKDNEKYLHRIGITNTVELDWWASHGIGDLSARQRPRNIGLLGVLPIAVRHYGAAG